MSNIRKLVDAIESEDFDNARETLKTSLAEYMAGKKFLSNEEVFGAAYKNHNDEELELKNKSEDLSDKE